ncbi:3-oxoadipate enol-lactonase [uncultured Methylovirgula sp.]|uniref:3-oxoadipate enol-lactonase n=1 Tax=uncultured Methylovirgula sp. TaxID=1285960 RepID=UPI002618595D|nr:3-oxoadipate enol-lactonase [uncultured Methylovirgula sp.]
MTETIIDGDAFNVVVEGAANAPAILLAHSLGTNLHAFDRQIAALAPHFRLVRFDARGHGGSRVSEGPYTIDQLGKDALAILDALDIDKAHFVGLAAGGLLGLWLLRHAPERIDRAVLANIAAQIGSPDFWDERIRVVKEKGTEAVAPALVENWFTRGYRAQHPEEVERFEQALAAMSAEGYAGLAAAVRDANFREDLHAIKHPVLVVVGKHDPMTPPGVGALVGSAIPGAKTVALEAAHLSPVEAAEAFNDAVLEFLLGAAEMAESEAPSAEAPAEPPPKKPRKPRAPKPKPQPAPAATHEPLVPREPAPAAAPKPRPRPAPKPKAEERKAPEPAPAAQPARKSAAKKTAKKTAKKPARKAAVKKRAVKKAAVKKTARKLVVKKRVARKAPIKKSPARKAAVKRRPVKKAVKKPLRKTAAKKASRKLAKRPVRKAAAKKTGRRNAGRRR